MLFRKIAKDIREYLESKTDKILILEGARQIGKSYIIREVGKKMYDNFVEINLVNDDEGPRIFKNVHGKEDFHIALGMFAGNNLGNRENTLIFIDEIQHYPQFLTMLKFLREENRYRYIASGSMLGIALRKTSSIPVGSIIHKHMYQLDFEEFLLANGFNGEVIKHIKAGYRNKESLDETIHDNLMRHFRRYLLVGGLPDAVNAYLETHNIVKVREIQNAIKMLYAEDASKYEKESSKKLYVRRIFDLIPSQMENKKKRVVAKNIREKEQDRFDNYIEEFEYLISSGITLNVNAISNPKYPLSESVHKNLLKLYLNDVGLLSAALYHNNLQPILNDEASINLGSIYENIVAQELRAHGHKLFYYDNRNKGEVDYLVDDTTNLSVLPIEVKSGKDYTVHSALNNLLSTPDYYISRAFVFSNGREVKQIGKVFYLPIYYIMFVEAEETMADMSSEEYIF